MEQVGKFFVQNFGCRATQADGAALETLLSDKGLEAAAERRHADLVVLNTCTVTEAADDDVRQTLRRVHRENPAARILVTGCYAQRAPDELAAMPGVEWVVGNSHKTQIAELVTAAPYHGNILRRRYLRAARFPFRARGRRRGRSHPPQSEDSGWLQQSLLVLHYSVRAGAQPQRARRSSDRAGAQPRRAVSRSGAERHQPGPLGPGAGQPRCAWRI